MAQRKNKKKGPASRRSSARRAARMPFDRRNYVLLLGAIGLVVAGYTLMLVDNAVSDNPVDSALSLTVAPLLLLGGYLGVIYAIVTGIGVTEEMDETPAKATEA